MTRLPILLLAFLALVPATAAAQSATLTRGSVEEAAAALGAGDPVYVAADAENGISEGEANALRQRIEASGEPILVAILPAEAGSATAVIRQLRRDAGRRGTYVAIVGKQFRAASDVLPQGRAARLADQAIQEHRSDGPAPVLNAFVDGVASGSSPGGGRSGDGGDGDGASGVGLLGLLGVGALGFGAYRVVRSRRRRREQEAEIAELREVANEDLTALGDDLRAIELDVEMPNADPRAKQRVAEAVEGYGRANTALDTARTPEDFEPIGKELEEARWDMAAAKALLAGEPEPERRPPCFFDPRHGPSVREVQWAPDGGDPRPVPVCAADAQRIEMGELPESREITLDGRRMPYWQAPGQFGPFYAGGMFGGFGGFAPGLLFGTMLGAPLLADAMSPDMAAGDSGGDFGGGDFGGGDFGGGDFGGGDFGGGDFGGGDF